MVLFSQCQEGWEKVGVSSPSARLVRIEERGENVARAAKPRKLATKHCPGLESAVAVDELAFFDTTCHQLLTIYPLLPTPALHPASVGCQNRSAIVYPRDTSHPHSRPRRHRSAAASIVQTPSDLDHRASIQHNIDETSHLCAQSGTESILQPGAVFSCA